MRRLICAFVIWAASSRFGTYRLCEQRRFRRACASAQSRQNLGCSLIQAVSQEDPLDRKPDPWRLWMAGHAQLKFVMTEYSKTQIRLTRHIWLQQAHVWQELWHDRPVQDNVSHGVLDGKRQWMSLCMSTCRFWNIFQIVKPSIRLVAQVDQIFFICKKHFYVPWLTLLLSHGSATCMCLVSKTVK